MLLQLKLTYINFSYSCNAHTDSNVFNRKLLMDGKLFKILILLKDVKHGGNLSIFYVYFWLILGNIKGLRHSDIIDVVVAVYDLETLQDGVVWS